MNEYLKVVQNYVGFQGRANRKEFWMYALINFLIALILVIIENVAHISKILSTIYSLAVFLPTLAVAVRRLHDTGRSGWWLLLNIFPIIGSIVLLVFYCLPTKEADSKYGSPDGIAAN